MKHIRNFSLFESKTDPMYYEITGEEFRNMAKCQSASEPFNSEIDQIEKILKKDWSKLIIHSSYRIEVRTKIGSDIIGFKLITLDIFKKTDEWFFVERASITTTRVQWTYYKCDQIDGLIEFLEDEGAVDLMIREGYSMPPDEIQDYLLEDERIITQLDIKEGYSMPPDEIQDYFLELTDRDKNEVTIEDKTQEELAFIWEKRHYVGPLPIYLNSKKIDRYLPTKYLAKHNMSTTSPFNPSKDEVTYMMFTINQPRDRIRGNLDVKGYTLDTIKYYLDKFVRYSKVPVNIYVKDIMTNTYNDPLSTSVVRIEFIN